MHLLVEHSVIIKKCTERQQLKYSRTVSLTLALDVGGLSKPRSARFSPGKETQYPLYMGLCGPYGWMWKISPHLHSITGLSKSVASRYSDCAISQKSKLYRVVN